MSLWEYACCIDGHNRINGAKTPGAGGGMTAERFAELMPKA